MQLRYLCVLFLTLAFAAPACADVGPPIPASPDFQKTPAPITAGVGIGLAGFLIFGGIWAVRHPLPALGALLLVPGSLLLVIGGATLVNGALGGLICLVPSVPIIGLAIWLLAHKPPFVGKSLLFLVLTLASLAGGIGAASQMEWTNTLEERRLQRIRPRFDLQSNKTQSAQPTTPELNTKPSE